MKQSSTKKPLKKAKVSTATKRPKQVAKPAPSKRSAKNRSVARRSSRGTVLSLKAFLVLVIAVVLTLLAVYLFRQNQEVNYGVFVCSDDAMATDAHCNDDLVSCNVALDDNCDGSSPNHWVMLRLPQFLLHQPALFLLSMWVPRVMTITSACRSRALSKHWSGHNKSLRLTSPQKMSRFGSVRVHTRTSMLNGHTLSPVTLFHLCLSATP